MLSLHEDVLSIYQRKRPAKPLKVSGGHDVETKRFVEFNGTITETTTDGERVMVARWSIDLMGRITVRPLN
jgi:hypothetical protein